MPQGGCPHGWSSGNRYQDTEDHRNSIRKSSGIESKVTISVGRNIWFYYCVKTYLRETLAISGREEPTVLQNGSCPSGFKSGSIFWDDEDSHNRNKKWGTLPNGTCSYNRNTKVYYCCRSDGNHNSAMVPPTSEPFILYRYGGHCQRVRGMQYYQLYIKWDDEDHRNRDGCSGAHPDATCSGNQHLDFCYYKQ